MRIQIIAALISVLIGGYVQAQKEFKSEIGSGVGFNNNVLLMPNTYKGSELKQKNALFIGSAGRGSLKYKSSGRIYKFSWKADHRNYLDSALSNFYSYGAGLKFDYQQKLNKKLILKTSLSPSIRRQAFSALIDEDGGPRNMRLNLGGGVNAKTALKKYFTPVFTGEMYVLGSVMRFKKDEARNLDFDFNAYTVGLNLTKKLTWLRENKRNIDFNHSFKGEHGVRSYLSWSPQEQNDSYLWRYYTLGYELSSKFSKNFRFKLGYNYEGRIDVRHKTFTRRAHNGYAAIFAKIKEAELSYKLSSSYMNFDNRKVQSYLGHNQNLTYVYLRNDVSLDFPIFKQIYGFASLGYNQRISNNSRDNSLYTQSYTGFTAQGGLKWKMNKQDKHVKVPTLFLKN